MSGLVYMVGFYLGAIQSRSPTPVGTAAMQKMSWTDNSIAAVPVAGAKGSIFLLSTTLSAEDEVLVSAAEKGDSKAFKEQTSWKASHVI